MNKIFQYTKTEGQGWLVEKPEMPIHHVPETHNEFHELMGKVKEHATTLRRFKWDYPDPGKEMELGKDFVVMALPLKNKKMGESTYVKEKIFDKNAKAGMIQFDFDKFKNDFRGLLNVILISMEEYAKAYAPVPGKEEREFINVNTSDNARLNRGAASTKQSNESLQQAAKEYYPDVDERLKGTHDYKFAMDDIKRKREAFLAGASFNANKNFNSASTR